MPNKNSPEEPSGSPGLLLCMGLPLDTAVRQLAVYILVQLLLIAVVGVLSIDSVTCHGGGQQCLIVLECLAGPHHKDIFEGDLRLTVGVVPLDQCIFADAFLFGHASNNHVCVSFTFPVPSACRRSGLPEGLQG